MQQPNSEIFSMLMQFKVENKKLQTQIKGYQEAVKIYQNDKLYRISQMHQQSKHIQKLQKEIESLLIQNQSLKELLEKRKTQISSQKVQPVIQKKILISNNQGTDIKDFFTEMKLKRSKLPPKQLQYQVQPIRFKKDPKSDKLIQSRFKETETKIEPNSKRRLAENLAENFFIIGPDINEFNIKNDRPSTQQSITLKPTYLYQYFKQTLEDCEIRPDLLIRAFPKNIKLKRQKIQYYNYSIRQVVEYVPSYQLNEDYFVFNMRGQEDKQKHSKNKHIQFLQSVNINRQLFILCLKLKDFIVTKGSTKKNRAPELWEVEKIYCLTSYYPFFDSHVRLLAELERVLFFSKLKILDESIQKYLNINLDSNLKLFSRSQQINQILKQYLNKKPNNSVLYHPVANYNYGTIINQEEATLMQALYASGLVFSNISYQQFQMILTAILCQKIVIFTSRSQTISTFTAMTLLGLIYPFRYPHPIILNADESKLETIFQSPIPLVASIAPEARDMDFIIELFTQANMDNDKPIHLVIDLDSNTILVDKNLRNQIEARILLLNDQIKELYQYHNSCRAKSLFLTKQLQTVTGVLTFKGRYRNKQEEFEELKKILEKECKEEIEQNKTKKVNWGSDIKLVKQIRKYISRFSNYQVNKRFSKNEDPKDEIKQLKIRLKEEFSEFRSFLNVFLDTQIFTIDIDTKIFI